MPLIKNIPGELPVSWLRNEIEASIFCVIEKGTVRTLYLFLFVRRFFSLRFKIIGVIIIYTTGGDQH